MPEECVFKYSLVLFHMFLYFQSEKFAINLQKLDVEGNPQSVIFWTPLIKKDSTQSTYTKFIDSFIHPMVNMLNSSSQPRINEELRRSYNYQSTVGLDIGIYIKIIQILGYMDLIFFHINSLNTSQ